MSRGSSGRIVLEVSPSEKQRLYEVLDAEGLTLKEWFLGQLNRYLEEKVQPSFFSEKEGDAEQQ